MSRIVSIDWGSRRVGVASADEAAGLAQPLPSLKNDDGLHDKLRQICEQEQAKLVVVGLPLGEDGQPTVATAKVREFARQIRRALGVEVAHQAETLTSIEAARSVGDTDSQAAAIILQDYLDERRR